MTMTSAVMMAETKERLRKSKMYRMCLRAKKIEAGQGGGESMQQEARCEGATDVGLDDGAKRARLLIRPL